MIKIMKMIVNKIEKVKLQHFRIKLKSNFRRARKREEKLRIIRRRWKK